MKSKRNNIHKLMKFQRELLKVDPFMIDWRIIIEAA